MKTGRKSILFGVHQFIWHPVTVLLAWIDLYGLPSFKELVCIIVHDWGYWHCNDMDGDCGRLHPEVGARIAFKLFGVDYYRLCLFHSRDYAKRWSREPSKLCWADKYSVKYECTWFYLLRAWLSGEISEYRLKADDYGSIPVTASNKTWFIWLRNWLITMVEDKV